MADPLSALGAATAALQIASQAFDLVKNISGLYSRIKDAPELMQTRISHLEQLIEISKLIAKTTPLQTTEVLKVFGGLFAHNRETTRVIGKVLPRGPRKGEENFESSKNWE